MIATKIPVATNPDPRCPKVPNTNPRHRGKQKMVTESNLPVVPVQMFINPATSKNPRDPQGEQTALGIKRKHEVTG